MLGKNYNGDMDCEQLWKSALAEIELHISRPSFATWFRNARLVDKREGVALVSLPNHFAKEWIETTIKHMN